MNARDNANGVNPYRRNDGYVHDNARAYDDGFAYRGDEGYAYDGFINDERFAYARDNGYAYARGYAYAPAPVPAPAPAYAYERYEEPHRSHFGALVAAVSLSLALAGAGVFCAVTNFGKTLAAANAPQVVTVRDAASENTLQTASISSGVLAQERCRDAALGVFNRDGLAANIQVSDLIEGGGACYYNVEFDRAGEHYRVQVNAENGMVLSADSNDGSRISAYDSYGNLLSTAEM